MKIHGSQTASKTITDGSSQRRLHQTSNPKSMPRESSQEQGYNARLERARVQRKSTSKIPEQVEMLMRAAQRVNSSLNENKMLQKSNAYSC